MKTPDKADAVTLTYIPSRGYCKKIGKTLNQKPKQFWLGNDEASAKVRAWELMKKWDSRPDGTNNWEVIEAMDKYEQKQAEINVVMKPIVEAQEVFERQQEDYEKTVAEHYRQNPPPAPPWQISASTSLKVGLTISDAKEKYLASLQKRIGLMGSLGIQQWTYDQTEHKLNRALGFLPPELSHMSELNYVALETFIYKLASRPNKKANPLAAAKVQQEQQKAKVSQRTVLGWIQEVKSFLLWSTNEGIYVLPPHAANFWKIRPEAEEQQHRTISQDELKILWNGCKNVKARREDKGERRKLWIMLGLNCGFYAVDIATLLPEHITSDGFIWKLRRKTRKTNTKLTRTKWKLWKETQELLVKYMPLKVTPNQIRLSWERLTNTTGIKVNHSNLRDTGAQFMEKVGGRELADTYLAHARRGVIDSYSHPDWDKLSGALDKLYNEFIKIAISNDLAVKEKTSESTHIK